MSEVMEKFRTQIEKIANRNYNGVSKEVMETEIQEALEPINTRVTDLETALQEALEALNNDDVDTAKEKLEGVQELPPS